MANKQVQIRRGSGILISAITPAEGELLFDSTDKRVIIGDGVKLGGFHIPTARDIVRGEYNFAVEVSGTNDLIITLAEDPGNYRQGFTFSFIAPNTNTASMTFNVNGKGVVQARVVSNGSVIAVNPSVVIGGGCYTVSHDGTYFQIVSGIGAGVASIKQGNLSTSIEVISGTAAFTGNDNETGVKKFIGRSGAGEYAFGEHVSVPASNNVSIVRGALAGGYFRDFFAIGTGGVAPLSQTFSIRTRYINSSPPFVMGDEEKGSPAYGFIYLELAPDGTAVKFSSADVPPWAYNGPTSIRADRICPKTGEKQRCVMNERTFDEIMDGAPVTYRYETITHAMKNADRDLLPSPFPIVEAGNRVVLLNPSDDRVAKLIEYQNAGGADDVIEQISKGYIYAGEVIQVKGAPAGIPVVRFKYKYNK